MGQYSVAVVVPPEASLFELAVPFGIWGHDRTSQGVPAFGFTALAVPHRAGNRVTGGLTLSGMEPLDSGYDADLLIVPTWPLDRVEVSGPLRDLLTSARSRGATVAGLCLGAFAVAEAGLLDGRDAVTHWRHREEFERRFPEVRYVDDRLWVDHGDVATSAGSAAALDCCLHLLRREFGSAVATTVARSLVTPPQRQGSQLQFVPSEPRGTPGELGAVLDRAVESLDRVTSVAELARMAGRTRRTLEREFSRTLGVAPGEWLTHQRILRARELLETTGLPVETVARRCGFGSAPTLRTQFRRRLGTTPTEYRSQFGPGRPHSDRP